LWIFNGLRSEKTKIPFFRYFESDAVPTLEPNGSPQGTSRQNILRQKRQSVQKKFQKIVRDRFYVVDSLSIFPRNGGAPSSLRSAAERGRKGAAALAYGSSEAQSCGGFGGHALRGAFIIALVWTAAFTDVACAQDAPAPQPDGLVAQPNSVVWQAQLEAARARHEEWLSCVRARRFKCDDKTQRDPMDALLNDDTLVAGDIVATRQGLKVFRGQTGAPHRPEDFKAQ
jgi:hypothetical protein